MRTLLAFMRAAPSLGSSLTPVARGCLLMVLGTIMFAAMHTAIRYTTQQVPAVEVAFLRNVFGLVVILPLLVRRGPSLFYTQKLGLHVMRAVLNVFSMLAFFIGLSLTPIARATALSFTAPLFIALLGALLLGEVFRWRRWTAIVCGFVGTLVILRPGVAGFNPAAILVLLAAFGFAVTMITTKVLTASETTFGIVFWMSVIQLPLSLLGSDLTVFLHLDTLHILPALGVGIAGLTSHYCLSNAFRAGDASLVVPLDFMRIPLIAVVGWAFYGERLDIFVLLGALIIVVGVLWNLRSETARAH